MDNYVGFSDKHLHVDWGCPSHLCLMTAGYMLFLCHCGTLGLKLPDTELGSRWTWTDGITQIHRANWPKCHWGEFEYSNDGFSLASAAWWDLEKTVIVTGLGDHEQLTRQMYPCSRHLWVIKEDFIFTSLLMPSHGILMVFKHSREATWPSTTLMGMLKQHKIMITVHLILAGTAWGSNNTHGIQSKQWWCHTDTNVSKNKDRFCRFGRLALSTQIHVI